MLSRTRKKMIALMKSLAARIRLVAIIPGKFQLELVNTILANSLATVVVERS